MQAEEHSTGARVYVRLHMHQLRELMSEQINIHGNSLPPAPAASLRPGTSTPGPPTSLILLIHFPALDVAY